VRAIAGPLGITRVANVTGLDEIGIPVVMVCRPNARSLAVSQGKGVDLDAARASGLMEALELYHAERITLPLKLASWNELRFSHALASVDALPRSAFSAFHADRALLWIEGVDLLTGQGLWLPYELVHMNYTHPFPSGSGCFVMSSNGLASGNHPLEAIVHGLCEVIERDATTLFHLLPEGQQDERRIDLATIDDPECRALLGAYARAGVSIAVWDVTSDIGVAAYLCVVCDENPNDFRRIGPIEGMGCHPLREVALARALTEGAQARLTLIAGSRDDNGRARYRGAQSPELIAKARLCLSRSGARNFAETPSATSATLEGDLQWAFSGLSSAGITQAAVVDLTKAEFGIPVVRVVVPGLETYHHVEGYVPGARARRILPPER
jgi:ribosomal protein S12 methylthiotransferase accessory factor